MRILFVAPMVMGAGPDRTLTTFHEADVRILRELGHDVQVLAWHGHPYARLLWMALGSDLVFCWTIGDHSAVGLAITKALRIPFVCVIGGYEFANLPEFEYGNLRRARGQLLSGVVFAKADRLLYVDPSLMLEAHNAFGHRQPFETSSGGEIHSNGEYVPTGYDVEYWSPSGVAREDLVVTVAHAPTFGRFILKGLGKFLEAARALPEYEFAIVGGMPDPFPTPLPPNVTVHGWLGRDGVRDLYRRAKVYCQLSQHEGLPNSLCEAMLCGAFPVGTWTNGIPTAIGTTGLYVHDVPSTVDAIRRGIEASEGERRMARERISALFPIERRRRELAQVLSGFA